MTVSDIQRYVLLGGYDPRVVDEGPWVTYADHVAAVAAAEQRVREDASCKCKFWAGHAAGVKDARDAVAALSWLHRWADGVVFRDIDRDAALAAIDALEKP